MTPKKIHPVKSSKAGIFPKEKLFNGVHPVKSSKAGPSKTVFNGVNKTRRNLLKLLLIGGGALVVGKIFSRPILEFFSDVTTENTLAGFRVVQKGNGLTIYDRTGEAIFIIDDEKK